MELFSLLIPWLVCFMGGFICIPFLTLFERKILSYIQNRKGPKKVGLAGILQPMSDGVKMMIKEGGKPNLSNKFLFWVSPLLSFCMMCFSFLMYPSTLPSFSVSLSLLLFLGMMALNVYTLLGSGIGSKSKYTLLGSVRGATQSVSYEVSLMTMLFLPCIFSLGYKMNQQQLKNNFLSFTCLPILFSWLLIILAETNRAPFDFAEGESELVSGFNTEYGSLPFTLLFLGEYGSIMFMSILTSSLFFFSCLSFFISLFSMSMIFFFVWCRGSFPRFRYDFLMIIAWQWLLPISFGYLWLVFFL